MTRQLSLVALDSVLTLAPETGGSVQAWRWRGHDVLRAGREGGGPLEMAGFPLAPFSGRIAKGRFAFDGREISLPPNFLPEPHAIHGQAWQARWDLAARSDREAVMTYNHGGDVWPWPYRVEQRFVLRDTGLTVSLSLTNLADTPMPAGIGWHPYFPDAADATLAAPVTAIWQRDEAGLATKPIRPSAGQDVSVGRHVASLDLDDCFSVNAAPIKIAWREKGLSMDVTRSGPLDFLIVYAPPGEDFFCVEPVSHVPDAVNSQLGLDETGLRVLEPGKTLSGHIDLAVEMM